MYFNLEALNALENSEWFAIAFKTRFSENFQNVQHSALLKF